MSEKIGNRLPPPLRFELGNVAEREIASAALLITVDGDGCPRVAVLGMTELAASSESALRIRLGSASHSAANVRAQRQVVLWCVLDAAAYSIRATLSKQTDAAAAGADAHDGGDDGSLETFELQIHEVQRDFAPEAPLISGPTYKRL